VECHADRLFDLAFEPYRPLRPTSGKDPAQTLLRTTLAAAGERGRWEAMLQAVEAVQRELGDPRTIWGATLRDGQPTWTLRLANSGRQRLLDALRSALSPSLTIAPGLVDDGDYEVLGLDLDDAAAAGKIEAVRLHLRTPDPDPGPGAGRSQHQVWRADGGGRELLEEVLVVEAKREITLALQRIKTGSTVDFAGQRRLLGRVLLPELFACRHLHVVRRLRANTDANTNANADALVFSGVNIDQLGWFLDRFGHFDQAPDLRERTVTEREGLDHLLFDVEVAYRQEGAAIVYPETTFYGAL